MIGADLDGKSILITGAAGALGGAVANAASDLGGRLTLVDLKAPPVQHKDERWLEINLCEHAAVRDAFAAIPRIDVLMHVAGGFDMGSAAYELGSDEWDRMFRMNVESLRNVLSEVAPKMIAARKGSIVTVGAQSALKGLGGMSAYCASKSGVMRLTESLSAELKGFGVNVNCVLPSIIDTPANRASMPNADPDLWVNPRDLAQVMCFLASDAARAMHGALVPVSGLC